MGEHAVLSIRAHNCTTIFHMFHVTDKRFITGKPKWTEIGAKLECNGYDGEVYLESSRGKVPTLTECKESCESAQGCKSISYFKSGWCSHFSTPCTKVRPKTNANAWRLNASSSSTRTPDRFQTPYLLGKLSQVLFDIYFWAVNIAKLSHTLLSEV